MLLKVCTIVSLLRFNNIDPNQKKPLGVFFGKADKVILTDQVNQCRQPLTQLGFKRVLFVFELY